MHFALSQPHLDAGSRPSFCAGRKLGDVEQALLWPLLHEDPQCPSRVLLDKGAERQRPLAVRLRHVNRWRAHWQLNGRKGRPRQAPSHRPGASGAALIQSTPRLSYGGVHLLAHGLDQPHAFGPVVARLQQVIAAHKRAHAGDDLALVPHRERTRLRRFQALFFAPLFGLDRRTAFATHAHPLGTRRGRGYHRATRRQFLGPLERIDAAEALMPAL